jgi:parallel beta-helix repeat protein
MHKKPKNNTLLIIIFFFSLLALSSLNLSPKNSRQINELEMVPEAKSSTSWSNFTSIHITGADWSTVENYDWVQGSGTWAEPYIIENITMNAGGSGSGITIESSTNVYFIIRNCDITNSGTVFNDGGIKLLNTNNGQIINNDCSNNGMSGVSLVNSDNNTVAGNTLNSNTDGSSQGFGVLIDQNSDNNTIYNNNIFYNNRDGIIIYRGSDSNNVLYNNISKSGRSDIMLLHGGGICMYNTIAYNNITYYTGTQGGIRVDTCDNNYILYNNVSNGLSTAAAISLSQANGNNVTGNIIDNSRGITIAGTAGGWTSSFNYISENIITYNTGDGLALTTSTVDHCNNNTIVNNIIQYNTGYGIRLQRASYNKIYYNTAKDNGNYGIYLYSGSNNNDIIYYNTSVDSIYITGSNGNTVQDLGADGPVLSNLVEITDPLEYGNTVTIQINVTSSNEVNTTLIEISGVNYTMTNIVGDMWEYNWTPASVGVKPYKIWSNDSLNNWNSLSNSLTVQDTIIPDIYYTYQSTGTLEAGLVLTVRVNATDLSGVSSGLFEILGNNYTMSNIVGDQWEFNWTSHSFGNIPFTIWVNDSNSNWNSTSSSVTVTDSVAPSISLHYKSASSLELGEILEVQVNCTDLGGIDTVFFQILSTDFTMINIGGDIWGYNWTSSSNGTLPFTVLVNDTGGNTNSIADSVSVQDTTAPNLFGLYESFDPVELGNDVIIRINITDVAGINTTLIEIEGTNQTMTNVGGDTWQYTWVPSSIATFNYTIWANDSNGNSNDLSDSITVEDTAIPNLTDLTEITDPLELGNTMTIQINVTDTSGINTTLIEIQGTNYTMTNNITTIWEIYFVPLSNGTFPYTIWCNDTLGNWNSISDDFTVLDTSGPTFNGLIENTDPLEFGDAVIISINVTDYTGVNTTLIEISGTNYTMSKLSGDAWEFSWTPSATGTLAYTIWANDTYNIWNSLMDSIDIQDTTGPNLYKMFKSAETVYLGNYITMRIKTNDLSGVDVILIEILGVNYSMDLIAGELWEYNWKSTSTGTISFTIWANDTVGNWNSISNNFIVESLINNEEPPIIIIIIIVTIGATISVSAYAINSQKKKKAAQLTRKKIPLKDTAAKKRARMLKTTEVKPVKAKVKKKGLQQVGSKPLTPEERAELAKTEKEVGIAKQKFTCIVHRGSLHGKTIYLCKHCDTFYCERCAKVLKLKGEKCWTCGNIIDLEISAKDRHELLRKSAIDLVEEIIQEKKLLKDFIESDKNLEDIPQLREYLFGVFTSDELDKIDLLDFSIEEKKQFIKEFISLDEEEREKYLDELLQK